MKLDFKFKRYSVNSGDRLYTEIDCEMCAYFIEKVGKRTHCHRLGTIPIYEPEDIPPNKVIYCSAYACDMQKRKLL